jgi:DNA repair protein RecO (recombination protein O)
VSLYRDEAVVLRTWKLGEADRIVVLLCRGVGKVRAVAKGARKTGSRFGARLEPGAHVQIQLYRGRGELDTVTQVEHIESFKVTRTDLSRMSHAASLLEAVDQIALEREPVPHLYRMLVGALRTVAERPSALVVAAFYWKLLAQEGVRPELDACVRCGEEAALVAFDVNEGGVLCRACRTGRGMESAWTGTRAPTSSTATRPCWRRGCAFPTSRGSTVRASSACGWRTAG